MCDHVAMIMSAEHGGTAWLRPSAKELNAKHSLSAKDCANHEDPKSANGKAKFLGNHCPATHSPAKRQVQRRSRDHLTALLSRS